MKVFQFRLTRVLDWREVERRLAAARVETAEGVLAKARNEKDMIQEALHRGPDPSPTGAALANWAGWRNTLTRHLRAAEQRVAAAELSLQQQQTVLLEANRRVKLLSKLQSAELAAWHREQEREMAGFANDLHLGQISRNRKSD